ncbi:MAG: hypothetical protein QG597_4212, partial [Actinomycetota bacterium]|nr:hypothetical protein [Actinomycetota bacterium]
VQAASVGKDETAAAPLADSVPGPG